MIVNYNLPIWPEDHPTQYYKTYSTIVKNFEQAFEDKYPCSKILFVDNTYLNADQIVAAIKSCGCDVVAVFSLVDPPYAWHYLEEQISQHCCNVVARFIGNESPDITVDFFWLLCITEMPNYCQEDLIPDEIDLVYLNYNSKPHQHRVDLIAELHRRELDSWGMNTLHEHIYMQPGIVQSLGDLQIWRRHFLNIDSATVFRIGDSQLLISEKEFKPLLGLRPFVINGSPRYYQVLEKLGFDLFDDLLPIDQLQQEKDTIEETMHYCHSIICDIIHDLSKQNLDLLYAKMLPRLQVNRQHVLDHGKYLVNKWCHEHIEL